MTFPAAMALLSMLIFPCGSLYITSQIKKDDNKNTVSEAKVMILFLFGITVGISILTYILTDLITSENTDEGVPAEVFPYLLGLVLYFFMVYSLLMRFRSK